MLNKILLGSIFVCVVSFLISIIVQTQYQDVFFASTLISGFVGFILLSKIVAIFLSKLEIKNWKTGSVILLISGVILALLFSFSVNYFHGATTLSILWVLIVLGCFTVINLCILNIKDWITGVFIFSMISIIFSILFSGLEELFPIFIAIFSIFGLWNIIRLVKEKIKSDHGTQEYGFNKKTKIVLGVGALLFIIHQLLFRTPVNFTSNLGYYLGTFVSHVVIYGAFYFVIASIILAIAGNYKKRIVTLFAWLLIFGAIIDIGTGTVKVILSNELSTKDKLESHFFDEIVKGDLIEIIERNGLKESVESQYSKPLNSLSLDILSDIRDKNKLK